MKPQVLIIHGGTPFDTYEEYMNFLSSYELTLDKLNRDDWKDNLLKNETYFQVIYPMMPNSKNAKYEEWKIWFGKLFPFLHDDVNLVGHSLGGIFLAKYLSENSFPKKIKSLHLVAAPYDTEVIKESLADFALSKRVDDIAENIEKIFIYQSKDDTSVAYEDALKYKRDLPKAEFIEFSDRGHFIQPDFPELLANLKSCTQ